MTITPDFAANVNFQNDLLPHVEYLLRKNAHRMIRFVLATKEEDQKRATDMVLTVDGGTTIAVRCRRYQTASGKKVFRDLTLRSVSRSGGVTELEKIRNGFGDWYLYAWANAQNFLDEWILVDLRRVRESSLLKYPRTNIPNGDGTKFISISLDELRSAGALVAGRVVKGNYCYDMEKASSAVLFDLPEHLRIQIAEHSA